MISLNLLLFNDIMSFWKRNKSHTAKSGEYRRNGLTAILLVARNVHKYKNPRFNRLSKDLEQPPNSRCQMGNMKKVLY